jgi:hypothetical protein
LPERTKPPESGTISWPLQGDGNRPRTAMNEAVNRERSMMIKQADF